MVKLFEHLVTAGKKGLHHTQLEYNGQIEICVLADGVVDLDKGREWVYWRFTAGVEVWQSAENGHPFRPPPASLAKSGQTSQVPRVYLSVQNDSFNAARVYFLSAEPFTTVGIKPRTPDGLFKYSAGYGVQNVDLPKGQIIQIDLGEDYLPDHYAILK